MQKFPLLDTLEGPLFFLLIQTSGSVWALTTDLYILWPETFGGDLCQSKVAVDGGKSGLEYTVCEEKFDIKLSRDRTAGASTDEATSLLEKLPQVIRSFLRRATILMVTKMQSSYLQIAPELYVLVGKEMCTHRR